MNKEMLVEMLKDATSQLRAANELIPELTSKEKVTAYIEMAKAYALTSIAVALNSEEQAPETVAQTKKQKTSHKKTEQQAQAQPEPTPNTSVDTPAVESNEATFEDPGHEMMNDAMAPVQEVAPIASAEPQTPASESEMPLVTIIDNIWIQFNRPVVHNDFDYSAWFMGYVNAVDENNQPLVGVQWANDYMNAFTGGRVTTVEALNDDNIMAYLNFVLDAIEAANANQ